MTSKIHFTAETEGYNKAQVDQYIEKLSAAYETAYGENQTLLEKCRILMEEDRDADVREQTKRNAAVLTKTMMNMEAMAQNIIAEAQVEVVRAKEEARKTRDDAKAEAQQIVSKARRDAEQAQKIWVHAVCQLQELVGAGAAGKAEKTAA